MYSNKTFLTGNRSFILSKGGAMFANVTASSSVGAL